MTEREFRLRQRIDVVTAERDEARARIPKRRLARCVYCGNRTKSQRAIPTCIGHRDLPAIDSHYAELLEVAA